MSQTCITTYTEKPILGLSTCFAKVYLFGKYQNASICYQWNMCTCTKLWQNNCVSFAGQNTTFSHRSFHRAGHGLGLLSRKRPGWGRQELGREPSSRNKSQLQPSEPWHPPCLHGGVRWTCPEYNSDWEPNGVVLNHRSLPIAYRKGLNFVVQLLPAVAHGPRHLLRLIKSLTLLNSCDIRKLQQPQTT